MLAARSPSSNCTIERVEEEEEEIDVSSKEGGQRVIAATIGCGE